MKHIVEELQQKKAYYVQIQRQAVMSLINAPKEGRLRVATNKGTYQYYLVTEQKDTKGRYIPKKNRNIAMQLAQRDYDIVIIKYTTECISAIDKLLHGLPKIALGDIYCDIPGKRSIITPYELSDAEYLKQWETVKYTGKGFDEGAPEIYTMKGERVRSKSEKIIADMLFQMKIPYRYEYPIYLRGYGEVFPDFILLNVRKRKEIVLEHFGMMDNANYCVKAIRKMGLYEKNDYYENDNLICSFETSFNILDTNLLERKIRRLAF